MLIKEARTSDAATRAGSGTVGIINVEKLMRDLVLFMPDLDTDRERAVYLEAVKDIALHVNPAQLEHEADTGALRRGGHPIIVHSRIADAAFAERLLGPAEADQ